MAGIYGTDVKNSNLYFAQQYTMTDDQIEAYPEQDPIQTALQQIINKKIQPSTAIPANIFADLATKPITIYFSITNSPTSVTFNFWTDQTKTTAITINNLDDEIYKYHGIGFICPGAVAQFTLNQPTDFIFSQQAISNYKD